MKKISLILLLGLLVCVSDIFAQGINPKMVYRGDINNIQKPKEETVSKSSRTIKLQIFNEDRTPSLQARIYIKELDEVYGCDSLGDLTIELPDSLENSDLVHVTVIKRVRINSRQVKIYTRKINIYINEATKIRKIVLSHYKKFKAYISGGGCPSF